MFRGGFGAPTHKTEAEKEEEERLRRVVEERIQQRREELKNNKGSFWSKWTADTSSKDGVNSSQVAERWDSQASQAEMQRRIEQNPHYSTNQSNEKYVKYYDPTYRDMQWNGPYRRPPHPRERHRCDYHLEDFFQSIFDKKAPVGKCFRVYVNCMFTKPGEEPERLRDEVWKA